MPLSVQLISCMMSSSTMVNSSGERGHPCLTPALVVNGSLIFPLCNTDSSELTYMFLIMLIIFLGTFLFSSALHIAFLWMESNAFWKSTNIRHNGVLHSCDCSTIILKVFAWSRQLLFGRNPACSSLDWTIIKTKKKTKQKTFECTKSYKMYLLYLLTLLVAKKNSKHMTLTSANSVCSPNEVQHAIFFERGMEFSIRTKLPMKLRISL